MAKGQRSALYSHSTWDRLIAALTECQSNRGWCRCSWAAFFSPHFFFFFFEKQLKSSTNTAGESKLQVPFQRIAQPLYSCWMCWNLISFVSSPLTFSKALIVSQIEHIRTVHLDIFMITMGKECGLASAWWVWAIIARAPLQLQQ